jgi:hypothetical protein
MAVDSVRVFTDTTKLDTIPYVSRSVDAKRKVWHYDFGTLNQNDVLQVDGIGLTGRRVKVNYIWTGVSLTQHVRGSVPDIRSAFLKNDPGLPKPNLHNVGEELFSQPFFLPGLQVGIPQGLKGANAVLIKRYSNVVKSFIVERTGQTHAGAADCLDSLNDGRLINKLQAVLPPNKEDNKLFADLLALKLNVAASATGKFPFGFGELTFQDDGDPGNPLNGQTVVAIVAKADTLISCQPLFSKTPPPTPGELADVLELLNGAFADSGNAKDTLTFGPKTTLAGVKRLEDVHYLRPTPGLAPVMLPSSDFLGATVPEAFALAQNYPNPFNPATTIAFELPVPAVTTLKIYNMLGQEIATLLDQEDLDEGFQEVEFDASALPSGVYFYRLAAAGEEGENLTAVKKMLLVR